MAVGRERFVVIGSTGGDGTTRTEGSGGTAAYASLSAAEAGEQTADADLTGEASGGDPALWIRCSGGTGGTVDSTELTVTGYTTTATDYILIQADDGSGGSGTYQDKGMNNGDAFSTSYYYLQTNSATDALSISQDYVRVEDLQFENASATAFNYCLRCDSGDEIYIRRNSFFTSNTSVNVRCIATVQASGTTHIHANTIAWEASTGQDGIVCAGTGTVNIYNNTIHKADTGIVITNTAQTVVVTNNAFLFCDDDVDIQGATPTVTLTFNAAGNDLDTETNADTANDNYIWGTSFIAEGSATLDTTNRIYIPMPEGSSQGLAGNGSGTIATATVGTGIDGIAFSTEDIGAFADTGGVWYVDTVASALTNGGSGRTRDDNVEDGSAAFASLSLAEAALTVTASTLVGEVIIKCQGGEDSTQAVINGFLFTGSGRLIIESDDGLTGHGTYDNDGRNTGTSVHDSSLYHRDVNTSAGGIDISDDVVTIRYLQFSNSTATGASNNCIDMSGIGGSTTDIIIEYNRFYHDTAQNNADAIRISDGGTVTDLIIRGNLFVWSNANANRTVISGNDVTSGGTQSIHNNTIISGGRGIVFNDTDAVVEIRNNVILNSQGAPTGGNDIVHTAVSSDLVQFNYADDDLDTEFTESTNIDAEASPYSNTFVSYQSSGTTGDYTPKSGSALADAGTAISGFTKDMLGNDFGAGALMDIGCFAVTAAGGGGSASRKLMLLGVT